jgi:predicted dehydrogenase
MTTTARLRWGILGAARVNERLLPAIVQAKNSTLIAIASRRTGAALETLNKFAPETPNVICLDNLEALLEIPEIDAVYIPLSNHEHVEWVLRALEKGKHVLCEKPLALTVADIDAIELAAKQQGRVVMEGFMYRFHPQHEYVRKLLDSGIIGELRSVRSSFSFMLRPERMYRLTETADNGGGALWDIGCYAIHTARQFFTDKPLAVTAMGSFAETGADIATSGIIDFGAGKYASFDFGFNRARRCEYELTGSKGGIKCHTVWQLPGDAPVISWWNEEGVKEEKILPASNHFLLEVEHFSDCVLNAKPPLLALDDAKTNCEIIVATLQSAVCGQVVKLSGR